VVGLTLRTASFKQDRRNLSDDMEDRTAEMTANMQQIVSFNQAFRYTKVDTRFVALLVPYDHWVKGSLSNSASPWLSQLVSVHK